MEHLMQKAVIPYLKARFDLHGLIKARILRTSGAGESAIDQQIADLETLANPTVGLAAHAGSVDIRITAKAEDESHADELIAPVEADLRQRLGEWIYGADGDTLEEVALAHMEELSWKLAVVEAGLGGRLTQRLADTRHPNFLGGEVLGEQPDLEALKAASNTFCQTRKADVCIGVAIQRGAEKQDLHLVILSPLKERATSRSYGGPPKMAVQWAVNMCLDLVRRLEGA
jgi:nicotinamide-nucleotide amidase